MSHRENGRWGPAAAGSWPGYQKETFSSTQAGRLMQIAALGRQAGPTGHYFACWICVIRKWNSKSRWGWGTHKTNHQQRRVVSCIVCVSSYCFLVRKHYEQKSTNKTSPHDIVDQHCVSDSADMLLKSGRLGCGWGRGWGGVEMGRTYAVK